MGTLLTLAALGITSEYIEHSMRQVDSEIQKPVDTVSIIMPCYNEERFIKSAAESIRNQSIIQEYPEYFEFILSDGNSTDNSVDLARPYVDKIVTVPKGKMTGKITARKLATDQSKGNIIAAVDSDTIYPYHWLNTILKPLNNPRIVGVNGSRFDYYLPVPERVFTLANYIDKTIVHPKMLTGQNSVYWKHLYYLTGGFNENINQLDQPSAQKEEEYDFGKRLSTYGDIIFKLNAACIHLGGEKGACRLGLVEKSKCNSYQIGIHRFDGGKPEYFNV